MLRELPSCLKILEHPGWNGQQNHYDIWWWPQCNNNGDHDDGDDTKPWQSLSQNTKASDDHDYNDDDCKHNRNYIMTIMAVMSLKLILIMMLMLITKASQRVHQRSNYSDNYDDNDDDRDKDDDDRQKWCWQKYIDEPPRGAGEFSNAWDDIVVNGIKCNAI